MGYCKFVYLNRLFLYLSIFKFIRDFIHAFFFLAMTINLVEEIDRFNGPTSDFKEKDGFKPNVKLEYIDDDGHVLSAKEAFRYLSHKFHGKGPGKNKVCISFQLFFLLLFLISNNTKNTIPYHLGWEANEKGRAGGSNETDVLHRHTFRYA